MRRQNHTKRLVKSPKTASLLSQAIQRKELKSLLRLMVSLGEATVWRGLIATPPGSLLEVVIEEFKTRTAIPLELPYFSAFSLAAQLMIERGAKIVLPNQQEIYPDFYTVVAAQSGRSKTFSYTIIKKALQRLNVHLTEADDPVSSAALVEILEQNQGAFWFIDEFGEFWESLESDAHRETKRILLKAYDHSPITRRQKSKGKNDDGSPKKNMISVENPLLSIYATTVLERLPLQIKEEDWKSGMCQRIAFVVAPDDPSRSWNDSKYWDLSAVNVSRIESAWAKQLTVPTHEKYTLPPGVVAQVSRAFEFFGINTALDEGFVRRICFRIYKYALVFHWLLGKASSELDAEDIGYASRLAIIHLSDLRGLLSLNAYASFLDLVHRAREIKKRTGANFNYRQILMGLHRHVKNKEEAQLLVDVVNGDVPMNPHGAEFSSLLSIGKNLSGGVT